MKRILTAMLALVMLFAAAAAEEAGPSFEAYAQTFAQMTEEAWETDGADSILKIALSETVTVSVCLSEGSVAAVTAEVACGEFPEEVRAMIENLGWLGEEELEQAFAVAEGETAQIGSCTVYRVHGESRDAVSICRTADAENMLWQPIHGGKKIHDTPRCSGMDVSRMITAEAAALTGWEDCGTCRADASAEAAGEAQ